MNAASQVQAYNTAIANEWQAREPSCTHEQRLCISADGLLACACITLQCLRFRTDMPGECLLTGSGPPNNHQSHPTVRLPKHGVRQANAPTRASAAAMTASKCNYRYAYNQQQMACWHIALIDACVWQSDSCRAPALSSVADFPQAVVEALVEVRWHVLDTAQLRNLNLSNLSQCVVLRGQG